MKLLPLLSVCLLTWSGATIGDQRGSMVIRVGEGNDVTLPCSLSTKKNIELEVFEWKKDGQKDVFFYNGGVHEDKLSGRVFHFPDKLKNGDASIMIRQVVMDDSGNYTCSFTNLQPTQIFHFQLVVVEPVTVTVMEGSDAILPFSLGSGENIESRQFNWKKDDSKIVFIYDREKQDNSTQSEQFRGRVSHFQDELKNGNASIKIIKTKLADGGNYTCIFPHPLPLRKFNIQLVVGVAPEPSVTILNQMKDWSLLKCVVRRASPPFKVEWQHSDGKVVAAKEVSEGGPSDNFILQATVTKTDNYSCVVTQGKKNHQIAAHIYVHLNDSSQSFIGWIVAAVLGAILLVFILAVLYDKGFLCKKGPPQFTRGQSDVKMLERGDDGHLEPADM